LDKLESWSSDGIFIAYAFHVDHRDMGETISVEEQDDVDWRDPKLSPLTTLVELASTTSANGPNATSSTT
jgi:hypothetical protein